MVYDIQLVSRIRTEFRPDPALKLSANLYDIYHSSVHHQQFFSVHTATLYVIQLASRIRMVPS